ncbi:MAG: ABC transporter ATP-binding protein [Mesorhizobium sp.]|nr:MAG: ABC transporter ATP-binding protein [Mesorhizobium sp.]
MNRNEPFLQARNISRTYGDLVALDNVSVDIPCGMVTGLIGPNGAGKSTLLSILSGSERPVSGQVLLGGRDITREPSHRRVGLGITRTFQDVEIFPTLTVLENILLGFQEQKGEQLWRLLLTPGAVRRQRDHFVAQALEILKTVGVIDQRPDERAGNLSYGQQKLLALARILPTDASFFMLDEPGSGLPRPMVAHMGKLLRQIAQEHGKGVVLVDHNMELVLEYAEHVIVMHHGTLLAQGPPDFIRRHPDVLRVYLARLDEQREPEDPSSIKHGALHA